MTVFQAHTGRTNRCHKLSRGRGMLPEAVILGWLSARIRDTSGSPMIQPDSSASPTNGKTVPPYIFRGTYLHLSGTGRGPDDLARAHRASDQQEDRATVHVSRETPTPFHRSTLDA